MSARNADVIFNVSEAEVQLTKDGQNARLAFCTEQGWISVNLTRPELTAFAKRVVNTLNEARFPKRDTETE